MSQDYAPAFWIPTDHFWAKSNTPRFLVVHYTADDITAVELGAYFANPATRDTSTHYGVDKQGIVAQYVHEQDAAWGNGKLTEGHQDWFPDGVNPNTYSLSIEHCKPTSAEPLTDVQKVASFALIRHLVFQYDIPLRVRGTEKPPDALGGIVAHEDIDPVNKSGDPGNYPWQELLAYLEGVQAGTVMATLPNFPMKDQRTEPVGPLDTDGVNENANYNCVATAFAAAIEYLTGKTVRGDELKDAEYGESYKNAGTSLRRYVDEATDRARALYGVSAQAYTSTDTVALIHQARAWLRAGFPVICTIPSAWNSTSSTNMSVLANPNFSTHAVVLYTENGTALGAMNPWGGVLLANPDDWWRTRLCYAQVWRIYPEAGAPIEEIPLAKLLVEQTLGFYHQNSTDDTRWRCNTTGWEVMGSILAFYRQLTGPGMSALGLSLLGLPLTGELAPDASYRGRYQIFEKGVIAFDPDFVWDKPAGYGTGGTGCYFPHLDTPFVLNLLAKNVIAERDTLREQLAAAQAQLQPLRDQLAQALADTQEAVAAAQQANAVAAEERQLRVQVQAQLVEVQTQLASAQQAQAMAEQAAAAAQAELLQAQAEMDALEAQMASLEAAERVIDDLAIALANKFQAKTGIDPKAA